MHSLLSDSPISGRSTRSRRLLCPDALIPPGSTLALQGPRTPLASRSVSSRSSTVHVLALSVVDRSAVAFLSFGSLATPRPAFYQFVFLSTQGRLLYAVDYFRIFVGYFFLTSMVRDFNTLPSTVSSFFILYLS